MLISHHMAPFRGKPALPRTRILTICLQTLQFRRVAAFSEGRCPCSGQNFRRAGGAGACRAHGRGCTFRGESREISTQYGGCGALSGFGWARNHDRCRARSRRRLRKAVSLGLRFRRSASPTRPVAATREVRSRRREGQCSLRARRAEVKVGAGGGLPCARVSGNRG